jgi:two-component sensor histidine kinase
MVQIPHDSDSIYRVVGSRLRALHEITLELSRAGDLSSLCKGAVEMGIARLGFDRLAIWFLDSADPSLLCGTWGTNEDGGLRDERDIRIPRDPNNPDEQLYGGVVHFLVMPDTAVFDNHSAVVGRSDRAAAPLWDGTRITGMVVADSFLTGRRLTEEDGEILALLGRSVAHLGALKRSEGALQAALEAKAVLLSELRHRTKNGFALISSLLSLETGRMSDPTLADTLQKLADRVSVLTSLYDRLDVSAGLERIALGEYLEKIAFDLLDGYGAEARGIRLDSSMESLEIDMGRAVPLGLIVNELITDSLKHAFPGGRRGTVFLALRREGEGVAILSVSDDGVGLPAGFMIRPGSTPGRHEGHSPSLGHSPLWGLGITLADTLCEQIKAELSVGSGPGAAFSIRFPLI